MIEIVDLLHFSFKLLLFTSSVHHSHTHRLHNIPAVTPHISPFTFDENVFNGDSVQVTCHVTKGDQPVNITWMFKEEFLKPSLGINTINLGDKTSMLIISSVTDRHMGDYTCLAENRAGRALQGAQLNVHGT